MLKLKTSDAKKKGVTAARAVMISMAIAAGGVSGGVAAARPLRDFDWPVRFHLFLSFLFCFVVYQWTAVNDKRLRGCYLKWGSAIPLVRGYETQKRRASLQSRLRVEQKQEEEEEFC